LYSPVALLSGWATVLERYEYDAYGEPTIWDAAFSAKRAGSTYGNPYMFTGRWVDFLDGGSLKIQYNRNRYYDYYMGRWFTQDPIGYVDGMNLYEYVRGNPCAHNDPFGTCACVYLRLPPWWARWFVDHGLDASGTNLDLPQPQSYYCYDAWVPDGDPNGDVEVIVHCGDNLLTFE